MSYDDDKRELLKLKQGIINDDEATIKEEKPPEKYELHGKKKVENFFYHYKIQLVVILFFALIVGYMIYQTATREYGDIKVLMPANDDLVQSAMYFKCDDFNYALESYCRDFDENGYVHVDTYLFDLTEDYGGETYAANWQKLYSELTLADGQMIIGNRAMLDMIRGETVTDSEFYVDLSKRYPDCENIVDNCFYQIKGSTFAKALKFEEACPEDMYIVILKDYNGFTGSGENAIKCREKALEVMDNIVNDNKVTEVK